jgi:hypothetical protein
VQRHDDCVVLVSHATLPLGLQDADHLARELLDPQLLAEAGLIGLAAVDLAPHGLPDDANGRPGALLVILEDAAARELPVACLEPGVGAAGDAGGPIATGPNHCDAGTRLWCHRSNAAHLRSDRCGIGLDERGHTGAAAPAAATASGSALAGTEQQQVGAQAGDLGLDRQRGAVAEGDHGDHCADADHDAQDGQE